MEKIERDDVEELLVVCCETPNSPEGRHKSKNTVLHGECLAQGRPWISVARECTIELRVQQHRDVSRNSTDSARTARHISTYHAMGTEEFTGIAHEAHDRPLTELVSDEADDPRDSEQVLLPREGDRHPVLAGAGKAAKEDGQAALEHGVAAVARPASSSRCTRHRLADVWNIPDSHPLYSPVPNVHDAGPDRIHVVSSRSRHDSLIDKQLDAQHEGKRSVAAADRGLFGQEHVTVHDLGTHASAIRPQAKLLAPQLNVGRVLDHVQYRKEEVSRIKTVSHTLHLKRRYVPT